jgi:hypothetical protein
MTESMTDLKWHLELARMGNVSKRELLDICELLYEQVKFIHTHLDELEAWKRSTDVLLLRRSAT